MKQLKFNRKQLKLFDFILIGILFSLVLTLDFATTLKYVLGYLYIIPIYYTNTLAYRFTTTLTTVTSVQLTLLTLYLPI